MGPTPCSTECNLQACNCAYAEFWNSWEPTNVTEPEIPSIEEQLVAIEASLTKILGRIK